ncbi:hypothetical protein BGZ80_007264, partial [Entomortierella chlamydospora]
MEWDLVGPVTDRDGCLHRRLGQWVGDRRGSTDDIRDMDVDGAETAHQLERTADHIHCSDQARGPRSSDQPHLRQYHNHSVRRTVWRHEVTTVNGSGGQDLETLSCHGYQVEDDIRSIRIQSCGCAIPKDAAPVGVVTGPILLPAPGSDLGSTSNRSVCLASERTASLFHDMETSPSGVQPRCSASSLEGSGQLVPLPALEPHSAGAPAVEAGEAGGNNSDSVLAIGDLVPNGQSNGDGPSVTNPQELRSAPTRESDRYTREESALESIGLASKRACLDTAGLIPSARKLIFGNACAIRTDKHYAAAQKEFIAWLELGTFEDGINSAVPIINWLCLIQAERNLRWSTVMSKKSAIIALFAEPTIVTKDPVFVAFMNAVKKVTVHDSKAIDFNIKPVLEHFRSLPSNDTMELQDLIRKLCWLLGLCGFMRPDDIACIDVSRSTMVNGRLQLAVVFPKEKRDKQRIIKYVTISPHVDKALCPISAYQAYVARLPQPLVPVPHQKDPSHSIVPLIRYLHDASKATGAVRIGVLHNEISRL